MNEKERGCNTTSMKLAVGVTNSDREKLVHLFGFGSASNGVEEGTSRRLARSKRAYQEAAAASKERKQTGSTTSAIPFTAATNMNQGGATRPVYKEPTTPTSIFYPHQGRKTQEVTIQK